MAQVGNRVVLYSSVLEESFLKAQFLKVSPQQNPSQFQNIFNNILKTKIHNNVVLLAAEKDTTIDVSPDDVSKSLNERIDYYINQLGSVEALETQMGMSKGEIKTKHWKEVRDEMMIQSFQLRLLSDVSVSRKEVVEFYTNYKDSIPPSPTKASFSLIDKKNILLEKNSSFYSNLVGLVDSLRGGFLDFESVIEKRSLSGNKKPTTSLRGDFFPAYERVAYMLKKEEISDPVETELGFFIIKLINRVGEKITTSHILLKENLDDVSFLKTKTYLDSLVVFCKNDPGFFDSLAVEHRVESNSFSGMYEKVDLSLFPYYIEQKVLDTKNNSFSDVFFEKDVGFVLYKYNHQKEEKSTLDNDWVFIENLALQKKRENLFELWIEKQYEHVYVKINPIY